MRPNMLWIFGDQHRAQALSCMGDPNVSTPHIDSLSPRPTTAISGCPLCSPFRGSLLTSRYPHECIPGHDRPLPKGSQTIAQTFNEEGYTTAYFGKWHVDGDTHRSEGVRPALQTVARERRGDFDCWIGYENNNSQYDCWVHGHNSAGTEIDRYKLEGYETDALTDLLLDFLSDQADDGRNARHPFFACLSVQPPHGPYVAPPEFTRRFDPENVQLRPNVPNVKRVVDEARQNLAGYYAMIENLDMNVGRVLHRLEETGLEEDTIVIFFSDHGDMHGSHGRILKCVPWEESIRVPFLVRLPNSLESYETPLGNHIRNLPINHVDIAPTTLGLCGIQTPEWMRGSDLSDLFLDRTFNQSHSMPETTFLQLVDPGWTNRFAGDRERPWRGVVTQDGWKYAVLEGQPWLMYNLNEDPYELVNVAMDGRFWKERRRLQDLLQQHLSDTQDQFRLPDISRT